MPIENIGWVFLGAGISGFIYLSFWAIPVLKVRRQRKKMAAFISRMKSSVEQEIASMAKIKAKKEVSELTFRDASGELCTVQIVVDPDVSDVVAKEDTEELQAMIKRGDAGTLDSLISGHIVTEGYMNKVQQFIFSPKAVQQMREAGMEPDDVVRTMLKAAGRIA